MFAITGYCRRYSEHGRTNIQQLVVKHEDVEASEIISTEKIPPLTGLRYSTP